MPKSHTFEAQTTWTSGREGKVEAPGLPSLDVASPPEFEGPGSTWTPEHFFVASADLCVMLTFVAMAEFSKLSVRSYQSKAAGTVEKSEGGGYAFTGITITARIEVEKDADVERAERLLRKAEASCLVSRSMKCPVHLAEPEITAAVAE